MPISQNRDGEKLFNSTYDDGKWKKAADAALAAIDEAKLAGHDLYYYTHPLFEMSDTTMTQMSIRGALTEPWNCEVIWGLANSRANVLQRAGMTRLTADMGAIFGLCLFGSYLEGRATILHLQRRAD